MATVVRFEVDVELPVDVDVERANSALLDLFVNRFDGTVLRWSTGTIDIPRPVSLWRGNELRAPVASDLVWQSNCEPGCVGCHVLAVEFMSRRSA